MKTFKQYFTEGTAFASGRWSDFIVNKLEYTAEGIKIYSGTRNGNVIYETRIRRKGRWSTVQYSSTLEEAKVVNKRYSVEPFKYPKNLY